MKRRRIGCSRGLGKGVQEESQDGGGQGDERSAAVGVAVRLTHDRIRGGVAVLDAVVKRLAGDKRDKDEDGHGAGQDREEAVTSVFAAEALEEGVQGHDACGLSGFGEIA